jgi:glyoxylase-like metal-dependent hydrolase (beta-lactamase superfamily II)
VPQSLTFLDTAKQMPLMQLPVRTAVIPLRDARMLFSPGSTLTAEQLRSAGAITDIVAPSLLHTAGMAPAAAAFPDARLWGPVGAARKHPELKWHGTLGVDAWPFEDELTLLPLAGMSKVHEHLALHRASRTLLATDLVFNIEQPSGAGAWLILNIFGTYKRFGVSRLFMKYVDDPAAFRTSLDRLLALDFDRLVPSHGAIVETDAKARLVAALRERKQLP